MEAIRKLRAEKMFSRPIAIISLEIRDYWVLDLVLDAQITHRSMFFWSEVACSSFCTYDWLQFMQVLSKWPISW